MPMHMGSYFEMTNTSVTRAWGTYSCLWHCGAIRFKCLISSSPRQE